jgi:hypothetical protein
MYYSLCGGQSEATLNAKGYSVADERRILDALGRGLRKEFPNPERIGCPGADVLKKIASRKMALSEAEKWLDHLGSCSPCYNDFSQFREASQRDRSRTLLAVAASILLVATVAGWALLRNRNDNPPAQTAILDLRNRSIARGAETNPEEPPLELTRTAKNVKILLPLGSSEGPYEVRIVTLSGEELAASSGTAKLNDHITSLEVVLPRDSLRSGKCLLQLRRPQLSWESYGLILR